MFSLNLLSFDYFTNIYHVDTSTSDISFFSDKFDVILIMLIASLFPLVAISLHIIVVSIIARDHIKSRMHCYALFQATAGNID